MPRGARAGGRIRPHERDTNDHAPILGADVEALEEHSSSVNQTEQSDLSRKNKQNCRNRLQHMCKFWEETHPAYYAVGARALTEEESADEEMFWWKNKHDVVHEGLNAQMVKAFLAHKKTKPNSKTCSHVQLRKCNDATLFGAKKAKKRLPQTHCEEMERLLQSFSKETANAKKQGLLDEQEADPISWVLFRNMLDWALADQNIFVWVFSLLQWHCMARSINMGGLGLHCFRVGEDNLVAKHDKNKADQAGEKVHEKHLCDNPFDPSVSLFLASGVWFSLESARFETTELLFQDDENEANAASQRHCTQLCELFSRHAESLRQFTRVDHANAHGVRKGSATAATSGATCPPPASSIAACGEWSVGRVLDLHWHFAEPGDTFLGRVSAGFDPNGEEFATLPPHWVVDDPMSDDNVGEAVQLMFAPISQRWVGAEVDPTGVLLFCLASVVWHSEFPKATAAANPGHPFSMVPTLSNPSLLRNLKSLVALEPKGQVTAAAGIPPHMKHASVAKQMSSLCIQTLNAVKEMAESIKQSVKDAFEEKAEENGQVTGERLKTLLKEHQTSMVNLIDEKLTELKSELKDSLAGAPEPQEVGANIEADGDVPFADGEEDVVSVDNTQQQAPTQIKCRNCVCGGRHWHVPKDFMFPTGVHLDTGWKMWIVGLPGNETVDKDGNRQKAPMRPIRKLKLDVLPAEVKAQFQLHWRPIFSVMEAAPHLDVPDTGVDAEHISSSCAAAKQHLQTRVSHAFQKEKSRPERWNISTWSRHVQRSSTLKNGTDQDKQQLPSEESHRNEPRQQHRRNKPQASGRRVRQRSNDNADDAELGAEAAPAHGELPDVRDSLSPEALARMQDIEQEVAEEMREEAHREQAEVRRANRTGVARGDGTTVHVGPRFRLDGMVRDPSRDMP